MSIKDAKIEKLRQEADSLRNASRVEESEVREAILDCLKNELTWTNSQLKKALRERLPLSKADRARANERPNEEKWEELVNNALSPSRPNSLPANELTESVDRSRHRITEKGLEYLKDRSKIWNIFEKLYAYTDKNNDIYIKQ